MNTAYSVLFLVGLNYFDVSTGAFTISITAVVLPVMLLVMRRGVGVRTWASAGCVQSLIISPAVLWYYPDVDAALFAAIVIGNGTFFPIGFAIPFIIMLQEEFGFSSLGPKASK